MLHLCNMAREYDYHSITFTENEINQAKILAARNLRKFNGKVYTKDANIHTGIVGEWALKRFFERVRIPYIYHAEDGEDGSDKDFSVEHLKIDLKTRTSNKEIAPPDFYYVALDERQYNKVIEHGVVNTLAFAVFCTPTNTCHLLGYLSLETFKRVAEYQPVGFEIANYKITTPQYACKIANLIPPVDIFKL